MLAGVLHARHKEWLHNGGAFGFYRSFHGLLIIASEQQILRKIRPTGDHLANKFLAWPVHNQHDAVGALTQRIRCLHFPIGINRRHLHTPRLSANLNSCLIARRRQNFSNALADAIA